MSKIKVQNITTNAVIPKQPPSGEKTILVQVGFSEIESAEALAEFRELARAAGAYVVAEVTGSRQTPEPKYYIGKGKADEVRTTILATQASLVLLNHAISPAQQRNLETLLACRVLDRTGLILDIFAQRARTFEGKLQVELAQLQHLASRLVRGWTHLERQRGGIGLRGPGETQLETDRRLIRNRIRHITERLAKVRTHRAQGRSARRRSELPTVSLVGYTNAGKSTLFNRLTGAEVFVANQLFATLDPTLRRCALPDNQTIILADTVGFIRQLPHDLVEAFRATLEETSAANLLLHVVDATSTSKDEHTDQVNEVLGQIKADAVPQLLVYNKIDLLADGQPRVEYKENGQPRRVWVSAVTGAGIDLLRQAIMDLLKTDMVDQEVHLSAKQGRLRATLYELGAVLDETVSEDGGWILKIHLARVEYEKLFASDFRRVD